MVESQRDPEGDVPSKATLFCPACDHRSRVDGDWDVVETTRKARYQCPDCGTEITVRPTSPSRTSQHPSSTVWQSWTDRLRAWMTFWSPTRQPS